MNKKTFLEIKNTLRDDVFYEYEENEIGMKIIVKGGKVYTVGFNLVMERETFLIIPMEDGAYAFVPYENILLVETP